MPWVAAACGVAVVLIAVILATWAESRSVLIG